jgi:hypothetical protein
MLEEPVSQVDLPKDRPVFCTECGPDLEDFCFSEKVEDLEKLKGTYARCRKNGRFAGELCAKLFIAEDFLENLW